MTIRHVPGKSNVVADALSRRPDLAAIVGSVESGLLTRIRDAQTVACGDSWEQLKKAGSACERGFMFRDGLLCRTRGTDEVSLVIPEDEGLRTDLLRQFHDDPCGGHLGVYRMVGALSKRYWWKGLHANVKKYCKECLVCQGVKVTTAVPQGPLQPLPMPQYPFESVIMDLVTHLPTTDHGYNVIYTVVDRLSKFTYFIPCKHTVSAADLAQLFLATVVARHGMPASIVSDRDPRFTSTFWRNLVSALGCKHSLSTAFHPETDGQSERMHRSIEQILHCYVSAQQSNWDLLLPTCEFALNSTRSATTGFSPAYIVFGREPVLPLEHAVRVITDGPVQSVTNRVANMQSTLQLVRSAVSRAATYMADYANRHRREVTLAVD